MVGIVHVVALGCLMVRASDSEAPSTPMPCATEVSLRHEGRLYLGCDDAVYVIDPDGGVVGRVPVDAGTRVIDLFVRRGEVWLERARVEAGPLAFRAGAAPADTATSALALFPGGGAPTAAPRPSATEGTKPPVEGRVLDSGGGLLVVDLGTDSGLRLGDRVELVEQTSVGLGTSGRATREERLAIGVVTAIGADRARVELGVNEQVPVGAIARQTNARPTEDRVAPPRVGDLWQVEWMVRPFLALDTLGAGSVSELLIARRFDGPLMLQLALEPLGFAAAEAGDIFPLSANVFAAYDVKAFEIGLGVGVTALNTESFSPMSTRRSLPAPAFTLAQAIRLGSLDGLHVRARNTFVLDRGEFRYGGTIGSVQIPIFSPSWLLVRGGGGNSGFGYGEVGLRFRVSGNGGRGSTFLSATLGGAVVFRDASCSQVIEGGVPVPRCDDSSASYGGPMVGFGMEWRL